MAGQASTGAVLAARSELKISGDLVTVLGVERTYSSTFAQVDDRISAINAYIENTQPTIQVETFRGTR
ncbi:hypothetical protein IFR05_000115 [Cadophora sp. M221]|nr:hypothetical protein IFR05_000115 [Cadophora sp. M221]